MASHVHVITAPYVYAEETAHNLFGQDVASIKGGGG